jgi:hypothetical protein
MALFTETSLVGVHTRVTDSADIVTRTDFAVGILFTSFTLGVLGVPVGSRLAHSALTLLLAEETSGWAIHTGTERVGVEACLTEVTGVVGFGLVLVLTETDTLTVLDINGNSLVFIVLERSSTGFSVNGHGFSLSASDALGFSTSATILDLWSTFNAVEALHSLGVLDVLGRNEGESSAAGFATVTSITVDTSTAHHTSSIFALLASRSISLQEEVLGTSDAFISGDLGLWIFDSALSAVGDLGAGIFTRQAFIVLLAWGLFF